MVRMFCFATCDHALPGFKILIFGFVTISQFFLNSGIEVGEFVPILVEFPLCNPNKRATTTALDASPL